MNINSFIKSLKNFSYELSSYDHIWRIIFPNKRKWDYIIVNKYNDSFYLSSLISEIETLEVTKNKIQMHSGFGRQTYNEEDNLKAWNELITEANKWLAIVKKDWLKANKFVWQNYPLKYRKGFVSHAVVRQCAPDLYRLDKELGAIKTNKFLSIVESPYFHDREKNSLEKMTANDYFKYCKIAYLAGKRKDEYVDKSLPGKEMYKLYADGRHEGLLDINGDSAEEFTNWLDGKHEKFNRGGGHPWEIKRGGNTTHINLNVTREKYTKKRFVVSLCAASIGRLKETIGMFLALHEAGLPITIADPEGIRKRLLAQDNIGVVPAYDSLHRANQSYPEYQEVYEVMHYDDLGKAKRQVTSFIVWDQLPLLKPLK
ncbi:MAG: hypothetical protein ACYCQI_07705 [Gammaproteobacteria bacterium]